MGILSEKFGRGFSRFYLRGIKASAEEREGFQSKAYQTVSRTSLAI